MPLNTSGLLSSLQTRLTSPFADEEERRKRILGDNSTLNTRLDNLASGLSFDPTAERTARTGLLDTQTEQARQNIARTFALDPSGIQTGAAIRPFSAIEGARLQNLAALESELSQRAGAENRANLAAQQSLLAQRQNAGLATAGLDLQATNQLQNQVQFGQGLTEQQRQFNANEQLQRDFETSRQAELQRQFDAQQLGQIGGVDTLANRQLAQQIAAQNRQLGQTDTQIANQASQFASGIAEQQAERALQQRLAEIDLTGRGSREIAPGVFETFDTLAAQELSGRLGLQESELFGGQLLRDAQGNPMLDENGQPITRETLASSQFGQQLALQQGQQDLQRAELFGGELLRDAQGNPVLDADGNPITRETAQSSQFGQQLGLEERRVDQQDLQFANSIALEREQLFGTTAVPKQIFDPTQGRAQFDNLVNEYRSLVNDRAFNAMVSTLENGFDPQEQLDILQQEINNKRGTRQTLAQQQLGLQQQQINDQRLATAEAQALERLRLTGTDTGAETISLQQLNQQDAQFNATLRQQASEFARKFGLDEAQVFGGGPSVTFSDEELVSNRIGSQTGDQDFRPEFDTDGNGVFEFVDFINLTSGSADLGNGIKQFIPDAGRRTLQQQQLDVATAQAAREFGLDERRFTEATQQFDDQFGQAKREFASASSGFVFNDDGTILHKWGLNESGQPVPVPVTTLDRDQFNEQKRQFNRKLDFDVKALADTIGVDLEQIDANKFAALMGVVAAIANTAGTVLGGRNTQPRQQDLSTISGPSVELSFGGGFDGVSQL